MTVVGWASARNLYAMLRGHLRGLIMRLRFYLNGAKFCEGMVCKGKMINSGDVLSFV